MHPVHRLGRLLQDLPRLAPVSTREDFGSAVLERLAQAIDSDSGIWASGALTAQGPDFHTVSLWRQPPSLLQDYEQIKQHDPLFRQAAAQPGRAFSGSAAQTLPPVFQPFVARHGLAQALSALLVDEQSGLLNGLSLWRSAADRPYGPDDEALLEAALPHLVAHGQAWLLHASAGPMPAAAVARGCVDLRGRLHAATPRLLDLLAQHWPGWRGPDLPAPLVAQLGRAQRSRQWLQGQLVLRATPASPQSTGPLALIRLDVRLREAWDGLSPREQTVAGMAADGDSHKDIALALGLAPATVRNHLARIYQTLQVHNRAQLLASRAAARFGSDPGD